MFGKNNFYAVSYWCTNLCFFPFYRVDLIDLAMKYKPLNLGQGFPDFAPPKHVTDALADVAKGDNILLQQYTRGYVNWDI